jgi:hypothetical protein
MPDVHITWRKHYSKPKYYEKFDEMEKMRFRNVSICI